MEILCCMPSNASGACLPSIASSSNSANSLGHCEFAVSLRTELHIKIPLLIRLASLEARFDI